MASVKGIGGAFLYSDDPRRLALWYREHLGIEMEPHPNGSDYYRVFQTRDVDTAVIRENPVFAIRQATPEPAPGVGPSASQDRRGFMLNFRVDDLLEFLEQLRAKGVETEEKLLEWKHGKHAWIRDLDGNRLELYEEILDQTS